ncbi:single-stranded DNA-binding protein [Corynebacterium sanguinis]|uniref:Single-stranded DNA-binding protein n=2 Tax=Corynebacteriaceae TaxID=1653 RepID=A0A6C1TW50_9CORY|nr:single-stranded DNA-binding protein [Corynebacterium sanguinis]QDR77708.1 single-stranded DNA-binding protein [Corynebacterium sanguinis]TVS21648.1 single-stranded DNA-binding protein [Corynebacterium sanguinis]TVS24590.1 single-stranded DNA-binding protein [Corynebacterium sanguinis]TVS27189.1 single-stranded DNA-binding protein [Corynebacterium sanguinis]
MSQMHITVSGNLIFEPEMLHFDSNKYLTKFRVASSRRFRTDELDKNQRPIWQETDTLYLDVECWGQLAINAKASLFKGAPVLLIGSLITDSWTDPTQFDEDGKPATRQKILLKASKVAFDLGNYQVSSQKTTNQSNTPEGMAPVALKTGEDLAPETTPTRSSAEDLVGQGSPVRSDSGLSFADAAVDGEEAPF